MWSYITLLSIFSFLLNGEVLCLTVTTTTPAVTAVRGSDAQLDFEYAFGTGESLLAITLIYNDDTNSLFAAGSAGSGTFTDDRDGRLSTDYIGGSKTFGFTIQQVTEDDEGEYKVTVSSFGAFRDVKASLTVQYAPDRPRITKEPSEIIGGEGTAEISCSSTNNGKPNGTYTWHMKKGSANYEEIGSENFTTTVNGVEISSVLTATVDSDTATTVTFKCELTNSVDTVSAETSAIQLKAPVPVNEDNIRVCRTGTLECSGSLDVYFDVTVSLTCQVTSAQSAPLPLPSYKWQVDGVGATGSGSSNDELSFSAKNNATNVICEATNVVRGVTHTVTKSLLVRATARPTTTPGTTTTSGKATTTTPVAKDKTSVPTVPAGIGGGAIAGIVVGAVVVIVVVILIIFFCKRSKNRNGKDQKRVLDAEDRVDHGQKNNGMEGDDSHNTQPDVVASDQLYAQVNKPRAGQLDDPRRNKNVEGLQYAELAFDNKPRSRNPIQAYELGGTEYAEIMRA